MFVKSAIPALLFLIISQINLINGTPTPSNGGSIVPLHLFYPSERLQQTVHQAVPSHLTESQMEKEMLHVLGLNSKPKPRTARSGKALEKIYICILLLYFLFL